MCSYTIRDTVFNLLPLLSPPHRYILLIAGELRRYDLFFFPHLGIHVQINIPCSPGNSKGGAGWRSCRSWFCAVLQARHAIGSPSVRSSSFISSPGRLDLLVKSRSSLSGARIPTWPFGFKMLLQKSPLWVNVAPHA